MFRFQLGVGGYETLRNQFLVLFQALAMGLQVFRAGIADLLTWARWGQLRVYPGCTSPFKIEMLLG